MVLKRRELSANSKKRRFGSALFAVNIFPNFLVSFIFFANSTSRVDLGQCRSLRQLEHLSAIVMPCRAALLTLSVLSLRAGLAQPPTWSDTTFDEAVDRRHDWCPYMQAVSNGTLQLRYDLRFFCRLHSEERLSEEWRVGSTKTNAHATTSPHSSSP